MEERALEENVVVVWEASLPISFSSQACAVRPWLTVG